MPNKWITFLSGYRKRHPDKSMKQAMRDGAKEYKSKGSGAAVESKGGKVKRAKKKKIKKVGTQTDTQAEQLLGGAIETKRVRFKDVESHAPNIYENSMREAAYISGGPALESFIHGVVDFRPRNVVGFSQYAHFYEKHPEEYLHSSASKMLSGVGASQDHPRLQRLVHESFKQMPEILTLYNRG